MEKLIRKMNLLGIRLLFVSGARVAEKPFCRIVTVMVASLASTELLKPR